MTILPAVPGAMIGAHMLAMRTWVGRSLVATVLVAGSLVMWPGSAQAYDAGKCNELFGAANVVGVDSVRIGAGKVDFGDDPHLGGSPLNAAVVCWSIDGRVAIVGKVFSDPGFHGGYFWATARIKLYKSAVGWPEIAVSTAALANSLESAKVNMVSGSGRFTRVRIRLSYTNAAGDEAFSSTSNEWR